MDRLRKIMDQVIASNKSSPKRVAVAAAGNTEVLEAIRLFNEAGLGTAILIGSKDKVHECAQQTGCDLIINEVIDQPDDAKAAALAVAAVRSGDAHFTMKGALLTTIYLKAILNSETGLKAGKLLHAMTVMEIPHIPRLVFIADCGMVIQPTLEEKIEIINNMVAAAIKLGIKKPKVACLGSIETISPKMPDTAESAILSKMAQRGQIENCIIDGPLSFDLACYPEAVELKKVDSEVAGQADILLMPDVRAGNICYKAIMHSCDDAKAGSLIMGATVPVILSSRSDTPETKLNSFALALALAGD